MLLWCHNHIKVASRALFFSIPECRTCTQTHVRSVVDVVVVPISFEGRGACVSITAGVTQHGAQGRRRNVILAVNRTLKGALIA